MTLFRIGCLALLAATLTGCGSKQRAAEPIDPDALLAAVPPAPRRTAEAPSETDIAPPTAIARPDADTQTTTVDAMVGQVNGRPIFASELFSEIGAEQLKYLGEIHPRLEFKNRVFEQIAGVLRAKVINELILAEAERGLSEREHLGLLGYLKLEREKIIARYGGGVPIVANARLREEFGYGIDEELERRRQKLLVDKFLNEQLRPHIHVSRREVERYYRDNEDQFNPAPTVTVRLILATEADSADRIDEELAAGEPFAEVAKRYSRFRGEDGGLLPPFKLDGPLSEFNELGFEPLNVKVRNLSEGEASDRTDLGGRFGWVMLDSVTGGRKRELPEVFLEIERRLQSAKFTGRQQKYMRKLLEDGNYTPFDQMALSLVDVAMARYARPR